MQVSRTSRQHPPPSPLRSFLPLRAHSGHGFGYHRNSNAIGIARCNMIAEMDALIPQIRAIVTETFASHANVVRVAELRVGFRPNQSAIQLGLIFRRAQEGFRLLETRFIDKTPAPVSALEILPPNGREAIAVRALQPLFEAGFRQAARDYQGLGGQDRVEQSYFLILNPQPRLEPQASVRPTVEPRRAVILGHIDLPKSSLPPQPIDQYFVGLEPQVRARMEACFRPYPFASRETFVELQFWIRGHRSTRYDVGISVRALWPNELRIAPKPTDLWSFRDDTFAVPAPSGDDQHTHWASIAAKGGAKGFLKRDLGRLVFTPELMRLCEQTNGPGVLRFYFGHFLAP